MNFSLSFPAQRYFRIGVSAFFFLQGLTFSSWASRIPDIKNVLALSDGALGAILLALPMGQLTAMGLSGYLVSRFGSKKTLTVAALLYPAALIVIGAVNEVWQLPCALYIFGIFGNLCNISVNTQGVGVERIYRRSIMASFHGVWSLAGFTGGIISSMLIAQHVTPLQHFSLIYLCTITLLLSARKYMLPRDAHQGNGIKKKIFVKPDRSILRLGMIAFASMICEGTMFDWSGVYFEKVVNAPVEMSRIGFVAFMSTMAGGRFAADFLATRFGNRNILKASGVLIVSGMMLAVIFPSLATATVGFLLVGLGTSSVVPMAYSLAGKSTTMLPGVALAAVASIGFLGFLTGPPLIGFIAELASLRWSFVTVALLGMGTSFLAKYLKS